MLGEKQTHFELSAAGTDDYISKPVNVEELQYTLFRWYISNGKTKTSPDTNVYLSDR